MMWRKIYKYLLVNLITNGPTMLDPTTEFVGIIELLGDLRAYVMFLLIQNLQDKM